jgi:hypothetical protein
VDLALLGYRIAELTVARCMHRKSPRALSLVVVSSGSDHTRKARAAQTGIARMTAIDGSERVGERAAGTVCSVDAIIGAGINRCRKSRFFRFYEREILPKLEGARRGKEAA